MYGKKELEYVYKFSKDIYDGKKLFLKGEMK